MFNLCDIAPTVARPHQPLTKEEELQGGAAAANGSSASVPAVPEANGAAAAMSSAAPATVKTEGVDNGPSASFGPLLPLPPPPADANGVHPGGPEEGAPRSPPPQDANGPGVSAGLGPGSSVSAAAAVAATVMTMGGGHPNGPSVGSTQSASQPAQVSIQYCEEDAPTPSA